MPSKILWSVLPRSAGAWIFELVYSRLKTSFAFPIHPKLSRDQDPRLQEGTSSHTNYKWPRWRINKGAKSWSWIQKPLLCPEKNGCPMVTQRDAACPWSRCCMLWFPFPWGICPVLSSLCYLGNNDGKRGTDSAFLTCTPRGANSCSGWTLKKMVVNGTLSCLPRDGTSVSCEKMSDMDIWCLEEQIIPVDFYQILTFECLWGHIRHIDLLVSFAVGPKGPDLQQ